MTVYFAIGTFNKHCNQNTAIAFYRASSYASVVLAVVILSVCPSVCLSVRRVLCDKPNNIRRINHVNIYCGCVDTIRKANNAGFLTLKEIGGRCSLPSESCAQNDPPPSRNADRFLLITSQP